MATATKSRPTMKAYQACGALCEIAYMLRDSIRYATESIEKYKAEEGEPGEHDSMIRYYEEEIAKKERWLEALDMAGKSLTR